MNDERLTQLYERLRPGVGSMVRALERWDRERRERSHQSQPEQGTGKVGEISASVQPESP